MGESAVCVPLRKISTGCDFEKPTKQRTHALALSCLYSPSLWSGIARPLIVFRAPHDLGPDRRPRNGREPS